MGWPEALTCLYSTVALTLSVNFCKSLLCLDISVAKITAVTKSLNCAFFYFKKDKFSKEKSQRFTAGSGKASKKLSSGSFKVRIR